MPDLTTECGASDKCDPFGATNKRIDVHNSTRYQPESCCNEAAATRIAPIFPLCAPVAKIANRGHDKTGRAPALRPLQSLWSRGYWPLSPNAMPCPKNHHWRQAGGGVSVWPKVAPISRTAPGGAIYGPRAPAPSSLPPPARHGCRRRDHGGPWLRFRSARRRG